MMINNFNPAMPILSSAVNHSQMTAPQQVPPQSAQLLANPIGSFPSASANAGNPGILGLNIMPVFSNMASNIGQIAGNIGQTVNQGMGDMLGAAGQLGAGALYGVINPSLNPLQGINNTQPPQPTQPAYNASRPSPQQILQSVYTGISQALQDLGTLITEHAPAMMTYGSAMGGATAVCSYMAAGMAATGAAMLLNQNHGQVVG